MFRLTETDSVPRVEDATDRHMHLCGQIPNADKYQKTILPSYNDMMAKKEALKKAKKNSKAAQDSVWLFDSILDDTLRDVKGRAEEFDRNNPGSNTATFIFPGGNISAIVTMPDKDEPEAAHGIAQKIISLGANHKLFPLAAQIENAVAKCKSALQQQQDVTTAEGDANTALIISKVALVRKYNANYFLAANDVDKSYAEKLFPQLRVATKKKDDKNSTDPSGTN